MAHTIRLWPRPASPATNTPGTLVAQSASRATLPRSSSSTPNASSSGVLGAGEAHGQQHEVDLELGLGALDRLERRAAVDHLLLDLDVLERPDPAVLVAEELDGVHRVDALAALLVRRGHPVDERIGRPRVARRVDRPAAGA